MLTALTLAACTGPTQFDPPVALDTMQGRRTICAISALGSEFSVQTIGMTVFGNAQANAPIPSWRIDDVVTAKLASLLDGRASVKRMTAPPAAFNVKLTHAGWANETQVQTAEALRKLTANQGCDSILVVTLGGSPFGNTNQGIGGIGIVRSGVELFGLHVQLHALFVMRMYDGRSLQHQAVKRATLNEDFLMKAIRGPHRVVDTTWWPEPPAKVEADARMKAATLELLDQALAKTLPEVMTLAPAQVAKR